MIEILRQFLGLSVDSPYYSFLVQGSIAFSLVLLTLFCIAFYKLWRYIIKF